MMTNTRLQKNKAPQYFITILFIFSILAGMLSSCGKVTNGVDIAITLTVENPATEELTLVPETEIATQMPTIITLTSEPTKTKTPEPTATATETPIPTEVSLIEGNIFFDPQSEADFDKVAKSPSPIDEPEKFAVWQDEYLKMIEEKLKTYEGPYLNTTLNGIGYKSGVFVFGNTNEWRAVAAYKFNWIDKGGNSNTIINKTFALQDIEGNKIPITITYTTSNSLAFDQDWGYVTPEDNRTMYFRFEWEYAKKYAVDDFIDNFLPNKEDNINFLNNDAIIRGVVGNEEQRELLSKSRFVFSTYQ